MGRLIRKWIIGRERAGGNYYYLIITPDMSPTWTPYLEQGQKFDSDNLAKTYLEQFSYEDLKVFEPFIIMPILTTPNGEHNG